MVGGSVVGFVLRVCELKWVNSKLKMENFHLKKELVDVDEVSMCRCSEYDSTEED